MTYTAETCKRGHPTALYRKVRRTQNSSYCEMCVRAQETAARERRLSGRRVRGLPAQERILRTTDRSGDCWLWLGHRDRGGYGSLIIQRRTRIAHRVSYEAFVGPIPAGLELDHLCRVPACVNPAHLEPVTAAENQRRKPDTGLCRNGHDKATFRRYSPNGKAWCLACSRESQQRKKSRLRDGFR
jgi:hypothetical protein